MTTADQVAVRLLGERRFKLRDTKWVWKDGQMFVQDSSGERRRSAYDSPEELLQDPLLDLRNLLGCGGGVIIKEIPPSEWEAL